MERTSVSPSGLWSYLSGLSAGRFALWCYFIWWAVVLVRYFDPNPLLWLAKHFPGRADPPPVPLAQRG